MHGWVVVIKVWLLFVKPVKVVLPADFIKAPVASFHIGEDNADFRIAMRIIAPHVIIAVGAVRIPTGFLEPVMVLRGVIKGEIRKQFHAAGWNGGDGLSERYHGAVEARTR